MTNEQTANLAAKVIGWTLVLLSLGLAYPVLLSVLHDE